jgi:hypothetical protein
MVVEDFGGRHNVTSDAQIEALLATRNGQGLNEFWLRHGKQIYPTLLIQVNGALARIHYFPNPGFQSMGPPPGLASEGRTLSGARRCKGIREISQIAELHRMVRTLNSEGHRVHTTIKDSPPPKDRRRRRSASSGSRSNLATVSRGTTPHPSRR